MRAARPGSEGTGAPRPPVLVAPPSRPAPAGPVRAGEWDDNANWREFNAYLAGQVHLPLEPVDVSRRRFIVVRDRAGKPLPNCSVTVGESAGQGPTLALTTSAEGRAWFFPRAEGFVGSRFEARVRCAGSEATQAFVVDRPDGVVDVKLDVSRPRAPRVVDVAFILDTTGSMGEEIEAVKETIRRATGLFRNLGAQIRIALVEYKDNRDAFVTRVYGFSTDLARFSQQVDGLYAAGGGDTPENANRGLSVALSDLSWSRTSVARMAFLIGDAPPHLDDPQEVSYAASMRRANRRGIKVYTIAASGMDATGQAVWRQIAQYTGATNMFVERGGAGPQSRGGGDPKSSCGGTQTDFRSGNLHELVTEKVRGAVAALDRDPLRIAGVGQDENAKPCRERLVLAR
ncbi:MAG: vWA domain-containing protein [Myxococcota bacterium]